jgi:hypothetical protein
LRVTVVIPLYNKERYVVRALESVRRQTLADIEILVIDDGSTDQGPQLVQSCDDSRVRLIRQPNQGPGAARNRGIELASGEYIAFLDGDDCWRPEHLEQGVKALNALGPDIAAVSSGYLLYPPGKSTEPLWRKRGLADGVYRVTSTTRPEQVVYLLAFMLPCNTIAKTKVVRRYHGFYSKNKCLYGEDSYLWLQVLMNEAVAIRMGATVEIHTEGSALSTKKSLRPVEPLLTDSGPLFDNCPLELRHLLGEVLALRAIKTASVLGYWGHWRKGRGLLREFVPGNNPAKWRRAVGQLCASPLGSAVGSSWRMIDRTRRFIQRNHDV